jgi:hypothetical protein
VQTKAVACSVSGKLRNKRLANVTEFDPDSGNQTVDVSHNISVILLYLCSLKLLNNTGQINPPYKKVGINL